MHTVVCIKQVPDSAQIRVHPVTNTIMRQGVPTIINPYDLFALEAALRLRDASWRDDHGSDHGTTHGGGQPAPRAVLLAPDRAVLLTDRAFAGSDTLATSFALSQAVKKIGDTFGPVDIVFTGKQTIDGDTAQVGPGIARRLGLNQLTYVAAISEVNIEASTITSSAAPRAACRCLRPSCHASSPCSKARTKSAADRSTSRCAPLGPRS